ncbi:MAG: TPM domain-containing protein [Nanoarchaeota archaeon]|nr:TPM domain-containing protein [Nanoarchaeota archaeon]MCG2719007.1 TPM domain-containing protein [Nanoarchaeota archaeon]
MKDKVIHNFLTDEGKLVVRDAVGEAENQTSGELVVALLGKTKDGNTKNRATEEFNKREIQGTAAGTGVLIAIFPHEHVVEILGDYAINEKADQSDWDDAVQLIVDGVKAGTPELGIKKAVLSIGELLTTNFPIQEDDVNELSDDVVISE